MLGSGDALMVYVNFTCMATLGLLMKCTVELTDVERHTLQQLSLNHGHRDFRMRATGLLLRARGLKVHDVARELEVSYQTVYNWDLNADRADGSGRGKCRRGRRR